MKETQMTARSWRALAAIVCWGTYTILAGCSGNRVGPDPSPTLVSSGSEFDRLQFVMRRHQFFQSAKNCEQLVATTEAAVTERRPATHCMYSPCSHELAGEPGRWLDEQEVKNPVLHGYDDKQNVRLVDDYFTTLYRHSDRFVEEVRLTINQEQAMFVRHYYFNEAGELTSSYLFRGTYEWDQEARKSTYLWDAGRLVEQDVKLRKVLKELPIDPADIRWRDFGKYVYEYSDEGDLQLVKLVYRPGQERVEYQRPQSGETAESLAREIEAKLLQRIPETIKKANIEGAVFCVFLEYGVGHWHKPSLFIARQEEARRFISPQDIDIRSLWQPGQYSTTLLLDDPELDERWRLFIQVLYQADDYQVCIDMLRRTARKLNRLQWAEIVNATDEFVVLARDSENEQELADDLRGSLPESRIEVLKEKGLWSD